MDVFYLAFRRCFRLLFACWLYTSVSCLLHLFFVWKNRKADWPHDNPSQKSAQTYAICYARIKRAGNKHDTAKMWIIWAALLANISHIHKMYIHDIWLFMVLNISKILKKVFLLVAIWGIGNYVPMVPNYAAYIMALFIAS